MHRLGILVPVLWNAGIYQALGTLLDQERQHIRRLNFDDEYHAPHPLWENPRFYTCKHYLQNFFNVLHIGPQSNPGWPGHVQH